MSGIAGKIRAVTFDVGHTLIEPLEPVGAVYAGFAERHHGTKLSPAELNSRFLTALHQAGTAVNTRADWAAIVDATFADLIPQPPSQTFFPELFKRFGEAAAWRMYEDVLPTLDDLKHRGLRLGVISNWDVRLRSLLDALELTRYFEVILISGEVGFAKPQREIFSFAATQFSLAPNEILHVGDNWGADVEGAQSAGFSAAHLDRAIALSESVKINSLRKLRDQIF